ncbi:MAG: bifunctional 23S rRNA (guanine(2069)-N(7))-methyltransferase RlmK/23S rRNA (guanine(2445)-N(2))-methyltransferase RlmL [Sphaerochaetaceae bacterium]
MIFFAASAANQNDLAANEAQMCDAGEIHLVNGGVEFEGDLATAYKFCLTSRIASRLLIGLAQDDQIYSADELYEASMFIPWENWVTPDQTMNVTISAMRCKWLNNTNFGAVRLKDAIVDRIRQYNDDLRPTVDFKNPDVTFHLHIDRDEVKWYVDFSGRSMHQRRYRNEDVKAMMKENLAAAVLMRSNWYKSLQDGNPAALLDPFCGSGTILIEAALMAARIDPGLLHYSSFAFHNLPLHDENLFEQILEESFQKAEEEKKEIPSFIGWDIDPKAIESAKANAKMANVDHLITFVQKDFTTAEREEIPEGNNSIVTDPPYGIRLNNNESIEQLYRKIGKTCNTVFGGWDISILCGNKELLSYVDMKPNRTNSLFNGPIEAQLAHYYVFTDEEREQFIERAKQKKAERLAAPLSEGAQMAYNRLKKNLAKITPVMEERGISSYRIYDADMPEYSAAIDLYEGKFVHLTEYAPPSSIDEEAASTRLQELIDATERATEIDLDFIFIKQRKSQKGSDQYQRMASSNKFYLMKENGHRFLVNFTDYLDTGIFLDHRPVRKMIEEMAEGKRFLNLFCYTGTATVHAACGGALSTVSVDASSTYLDWAIKNMDINGFNEMNHFFYKEDCITWLKSTYDTYDLIFCDPPTFSNSKMRDMFDIQKDQKILIHQCMNHLSKDGTLIFSTNYRKFKMDEQLADQYQVEDISESTIPEDFKRNAKIHYCYTIRHRKVKPVPLDHKKTKKVVKKNAQ